MGDRVLLESERGYNMTIPRSGVALARELIVSERKFVATPLSCGLRIGGAAEFGGLNAAANFERSRALVRLARKYLPQLQTEGGISWAGHRPATPGTCSHARAGNTVSAVARPARLRQHIQTDGAGTGIRRSIAWIRAHYHEPLRVGHLARVAHMSVASFHRHFKATTAMSPIQYQKQVRLLEARQRLLGRPGNIAQVAFAVGYQSLSQFSREYARQFGSPPARDTARFSTPAFPRLGGTSAARPLLVMSSPRH